jgi:hypothetical protein
VCLFGALGEIDGDFVVVAAANHGDVVRAPSRHNARATSMSMASITAILRSRYHPTHTATLECLPQSRPAKRVGAVACSTLRVFSVDATRTDSVPLTSRETAECDKADDGDYRTEQDAPNERDDDPDDHQYAADRYATDFAISPYSHECPP